MALRLDAAIAEVPLPNGQRSDAFARAERAAWEETGEAYRPALLADVPLSPPTPLFSPLRFTTAPTRRALWTLCRADPRAQPAGRPLWLLWMGSLAKRSMMGSASALVMYPVCRNCYCALCRIAVMSMTCTPRRVQTRVRTLSGWSSIWCRGHLPYWSGELRPPFHRACGSGPSTVPAGAPRSPYPVRHDPQLAC